MKSIEEANEYFENQQAISNLKSAWRDSIPETDKQAKKVHLTQNNA